MDWARSTSAMKPGNDRQPSGSVAVALRFVSADQLLQAAQRSVRVPLAEAASIIRTMVPGYSFDADALFEEPDAKRQRKSKAQ